MNVTPATRKTCYTSQPAPLPDVWRPLASSWPGFVRALTIAREVDPDGLVTTIRRYGLDTPETVAFVRRAVNRDMGKDDSEKQATRRRRRCTACKERWVNRGSRWCAPCRDAIIADHSTCGWCGDPLPAVRRMDRRYCSETCEQRAWRARQAEGFAGHNRVH